MSLQPKTAYNNYSLDPKKLPMLIGGRSSEVGYGIESQNETPKGVVVGKWLVFGGGRSSVLCHMPKKSLKLPVQKLPFEVHKSCT